MQEQKTDLPETFVQYTKGMPCPGECGKPLREILTDMKHVAVCCDTQGCSFLGSMIFNQQGEEWISGEYKRRIPVYNFTEFLGIEILRKELFTIEPKIDLLHDLLGFGRFVEVTKTSDGFYLGQEHGDLGFNAFLGNPSEIATQRLNKQFSQLSDSAKKQALLNPLVSELVQK